MQVDNDAITLPYIAQMIIKVLRGGPHRVAQLCGFQTHWYKRFKFNCYYYYVVYFDQRMLALLVKIIFFFRLTYFSVTMEKTGEKCKKEKKWVLRGFVLRGKSLTKKQLHKLAGNPARRCRFTFSIFRVRYQKIFNYGRISV